MPPTSPCFADQYYINTQAIFCLLNTVLDTDFSFFLGGVTVECTASETFPQIITMNEAKRRQSFSSFEDEEPLDLLSVLTDPSTLFEDTHIEKVLQKLACTYIHN